MAIDAPEVDVTDEVDAFAEAIRAFRERVPMTDAEFAAMEADAEAIGFKVANVMSANVIAQVFDAMDAAISQGMKYEDFKATVAPMLEDSWGGERPGLIENVFRTNTMAAYNEGRYAIQTAPAVKKARPFFRMDVIRDSRISKYCEPCDGVILEQDDPWWDENYPPRHYQCRSHVTALTAKEAKREGITRKKPTQKAMEGFGKRPNSTGDDWEPDTTGLPDGVREELDQRLEDGDV